MTREEFEKKKADSAKRIREMYAGRNMPPYPDFVKVRAEQGKEEKPDKPRPTASKKMVAPPQQGFSAEGLLRSLNIEQIIKNYQVRRVLQVMEAAWKSAENMQTIKVDI